KMIQLYHTMGTLVTRLWRALVAPPTPMVPPGGPRVLLAYAALARYQTNSPDLDPRLRLLVTQLAAERSRCRWCIDRGRHLWREAQLPIDALDGLARYETSALFSNRERAALRFTDAVTRYSEANGGMPLESPRRPRTSSGCARKSRRGAARPRSAARRSSMDSPIRKSKRSSGRRRMRHTRMLHAPPSAPNLRRRSRDSSGGCATLRRSIISGL